jgi:hypothetical protein
LEELAKKWKAEDEEQLDMAKNRKPVAEASAQLVLMFQQFSTPPANLENVSVAMEGKMAATKNDIMAEIGLQMEESKHEVKDEFIPILGLVQGLAGNQNTGNAS